MDVGTTGESHVMRARSVAFALAAVCVFSAGSAAAQAVDMDRFDGRWFEITRSPNDVQKDCRRAQIDFTAQARKTPSSAPIWLFGVLRRLGGSTSFLYLRGSEPLDLSLAARVRAPAVVGGAGAARAQ